MQTTALDQSIEATPMTSNPEMMSAIVQDAYGTAPEAVLRLAAIARPTIGDDQVLVRVAAASVDRGTWHSRLMTADFGSSRKRVVSIRTRKSRLCSSNVRSSCIRRDR